MAQQVDVAAIDRRLQIHTGQVAALLGEVAFFIEHVSDTSAHAGGEVAAGAAEHDDKALGHVFATVISQALHHGRCAGIAHGESLAGHAIEVSLTARRAIEHDVADEDVLFRQEGGFARRIHDQPAAGQSFADVIVGVAFERERNALGQKRAETLSRRTGKLDTNGLVGQPFGAVAPGNLSAEHGPHRAMHIAYRQLDLDRDFLLDGILRQIDELVIESLAQAVILRLHAAPRDALRHHGIKKDGREIEAPRLPVIDGLARIQQIDAPHHVLELAEAQLRHVLAHLLGDIEEEVDDVLRLSLELGAQQGILRGHPDRTGIQVAFAHHDAAHGHERRGREAELFGPQQRGDGHVASGLQLAIGLDADAAAQIVHDQHLLRLGQSQLPGNAGVLERSEGRSAGAAGVAADQHDVGMGFRNPCRHRANAHFGYQLDRNTGPRIGVLQIVNKLRQIFDGIDIVMRRRRDQAHSGNGMADLGDEVVHFVAGKLAALAGLGALRHLDLQFVCVHQVVGGDAEARRSDLLDRRAAQIAVGISLEAAFVFPAFARVGFAADAVHGDGQGLVRLLADGAERHRAGSEALDDRRSRLHLLQRNGIIRLLDFEQAAQGTQLRVLLVDQIGVFPEGGIALLPDRVLQLRHRQRIEQVIFAADTVLIVASDGQLGVRVGDGLKGMLMLHPGFASQYVQAHALDTRSGSGEVFLHYRLVQADGFEHLRAAIALERRNPHLAGHFEQSLIDGLDVILERLVERDALREIAALRKIFQRLDGQVRIDGASAIAHEQREVHHLAGLAGFHHQRHLRAAPLAHEVIVQSRQR